MKVKMKEHYQDAKVHYEPEQIVEVGKAMGEWLLQHRKAEAISEPGNRFEVEPQFEQAEEPPHYGAQAEAQLRADDEIYPVPSKKRNRRGAK